MDDASRVRLGHPGAGLQHVVDRLGHRQRPALLEQAPQVHPLELLHDEEHVVAVAPHVHHAHHVLALQGDGGARLAGHPLGRGRVGLAQHLDGHVLVEPRVQGRQDHACRAATELRLDDVLAREGAARPGKVRHPMER